MPKDRFRRLRIVGDDESPDKTEGMGACKYCIHARAVNSGRFADLICTVFYKKFAEDIRRRKTDALGRIYLPDCREFRERPFSKPRKGFIGTAKNVLGKILYPLIIWLKK